MNNKKYKWFLTKRNRAMKKNTPVAKDNNDFLNNPEKPKKIDNK